MHIEFESTNWSQPGWILEDDRIIVKKRIGRDKEYLIADIETISHDPNPKKMRSCPAFSFICKGSFESLWYSNTEPVKSQGAEAVAYIKSKMAEAKLKATVDKKAEIERKFNEKIAGYKKEKTKIYDENLEVACGKYFPYIGNYLMGLPKDGEYIIAGAKTDEIANSNEALRQFRDAENENFIRLIEYLCNNKILIKRDSLIKETTFRLACSLEKEPTLEDSKVKIAVFACMFRKKNAVICTLGR